METRQHFNEALKELDQDILRMSTQIEEAINTSVTAFEKKDIALAEKIIEGDAEINDRQAEIEDKCTVLLATEQPVATDLRRIVSIIKIVSNLERIGDHAVHLAKSTLKFIDEPYIARVTGIIPRMAEIGVTMIRETIDSFVNRDLNKAKATASLDEKNRHTAPVSFRHSDQYNEREPQSYRAGHRVSVHQPVYGETRGPCHQYV